MCSRSAENASESVRIRDRSECWWGTQPVIYMPPWCPTTVRATEGYERHGVPNPAARVHISQASQPAAVAYRGKLASRSVPTDQGASCWSLAQVLCRLTPAGPREGRGGPPCESRERAGGDTPHSPRAHLHELLWRNSGGEGEHRTREARRGEHTPRRATSTRTTRAIRRASMIAPEVQIIVNESMKIVASRESVSQIEV